MYCIVGLSTIGNISFGCALVAGKNLVPSPAAGITAFRNFIKISPSYKKISPKNNFWTKFLQILKFKN
jgi:hypothetical protein